jgi:hypothetical protein
MGWSDQDVCSDTGRTTLVALNDSFEHSSSACLPPTRSSGLHRCVSERVGRNSSALQFLSTERNLRPWPMVESKLNLELSRVEGGRADVASSLSCSSNEGGPLCDNQIGQHSYMLQHQSSERIPIFVGSSSSFSSIFSSSPSSSSSSAHTRYRQREGRPIESTRSGRRIYDSNFGPSTISAQIPSKNRRRLVRQLEEQAASKVRIVASRSSRGRIGRLRSIQASFLSSSPSSSFCLTSQSLEKGDNGKDNSSGDTPALGKSALNVSATTHGNNLRGLRRGRRDLASGGVDDQPQRIAPPGRIAIALVDTRTTAETNASTTASPSFISLRESLNICS